MRSLAAVALALALLACSDAQEVSATSQGACATWQDVQPLTSSCASCHGATDPKGSFRTDSYNGVVAAATAGDAHSTLLETLDPSAGDATHRTLLDAGQLAKVKSWVVDCRLASVAARPGASVHQSGAMDRASTGFHGKLAQDAHGDFTFASCKECHGADLDGGGTEPRVSCQSCHGATAVSACASCHGAPPRTGAHVAHVVTAALASSISCATCHAVPANGLDPTHLHGGAGRVALSGRAGATASYDAATRKCTSVACHGSALADSAATNVAPVWTGGASQGACGTCHGAPPAAHRAGMTDCQGCHAAVVDAQKKIIDPSKHVDGTIEQNVATATCTACHGAPPDTGAHVAHVAGEDKLASPVDCSDCHARPSTLFSPGHMDGVAGVFTAQMVGTGSNAYADGASPAWSDATQTCTNAYCHGNGKLLLRDTTAGLKRIPTWTGGEDTIACGACHGLPPDDGLHPQSSGLTDCVRCHAATMTADGKIRFVNGLSTHMNGVNDGN